MKYIITENQLKTLRKYMKTFINEDVVKGIDALKTFPFSELADTYEEYRENGFNGRVEGWGSVQIPIDVGVSRTINTKDDFRKFINSFDQQYKQEPMFEINDFEKKIKIVDKDGNDIFKNQQDSIGQDFRYWQDRRNRGDFGR